MPLVFKIIHPLYTIMSVFQVVHHHTSTYDYLLCPVFQGL